MSSNDDERDVWDVPVPRRRNHHIGSDDGPAAMNPPLPPPRNRRVLDSPLHAPSESTQSASEFESEATLQASEGPSSQETVDAPEAAIVQLERLSVSTTDDDEPIARLSNIGERRQDLRRIADRNRRELESPDLRINRLQARAQVRAAQSPAAREHRLSQQRAAMAAVRARPGPLLNAAFNYDCEIDYSNHPMVTFSPMDKICRFCSARRFEDESPGICCALGKVRLDTFPEPPEPILSLYSGDPRNPGAAQFIKNIRYVNSLFQMTSFGVSGGVVRERNFMDAFKVQGQVYHLIGSLLPEPGQQPRYLQLYFLNSEEQVQQRASNVPENVIRVIQNLLHEQNSLIRGFVSAIRRMPSNEQRLIIRADLVPAGEHPGRYNAPVVEEVAGIMIDGEFSRRDIVLRRTDHSLMRIYETHRSYDALQYPLILWRGDDTYHFNIPLTDPASGRQIDLGRRKTVTSMQFYAYQFMIREEQQSFILKCAGLLNQYAVDMYAKIEGERLRFIRMNQSNLRVTEYIHLRDAVEADSDVENIGRRCILPSSFIGSPRHMAEYTQDAIAYVRKHGRPDFFITFTCNRSWPEIKQYLLMRQSPSDRNDLIARIFRRKLRRLIQVLFNKGLFGPAKCFMYTVEWQKRGLPHSHILLWLENRVRPEQLDSVISAELPDPNNDPDLFQIISRDMIHGPCGAHTPNLACMANGRTCSKKFPRAFLRETITGNDGYPMYRRRSPDDGGYAFVRGEETIDNRWVVPYNPILSKMFNYHLNVEYCHSVRSIKYICKYINKGSDMAIVERQHPNDEISQYQVGRYLNSNEAFWRIFHFPIHDRFPAVQTLQVHLENGQRVYFRPDNAPIVADRATKSTLTAFFDLCQRDVFAKTLTYPEVPTYYRWNQSSRSFSRRLRGRPTPFDGIVSDPTIGRVYTVHPSHGDCFYLRMLLMKVKGPTSFRSIRTVDGRICATYREACLRLGLLEDDAQWETCLREAAETKNPQMIRSLFALIIAECEPSNPLRLWELFRESMAEDILNRARRVAPDVDVGFGVSIFNEALILIDDLCLQASGRSVGDCGLPSPDRANRDILDIEILRETNYDPLELEAYVERALPQLVPDQRTAAIAIRTAISNQTGGLFFLDAPGGTGKSFLLNFLLAHFRSQRKIIIAVASSGIAATVLAGGRNAHSAFKLPLDMHANEMPSCAVTKNSSRGKLLSKCCAIVWDECTMAHRKSLEALDRCLRDIRSSDTLMGGVVVVLAGDFRQTLPVIQRGTPADAINACLKQSYIWPHVRIFRLRTNMRAQLTGDTQSGDFARVLLEIGDGIYPKDPNTGEITLSSRLCNVVSSREELISNVFPRIQINYVRHDWLCERAILAPLNDEVDELNRLIQDRISNVQSRTYLSIDSTVDPEQALHYPVEFLNSLSPPGFPHHQIIVKKGSPIILLRNISPPKLVNGTRLVVTNLRANLICAKIMVGNFKGETVLIPRIPLKSSDLVVDMRRLQFPIKLAYAMTINKSQGQTLGHVGIDLTTRCFSHGQLYVACSRVGKASSVCVLAPDSKTVNVVYPQALR